jgi:hypothetical protein
MLPPKEFCQEVSNRTGLLEERAHYSTSWIIGPKQGIKHPVNYPKRGFVIKVTKMGDICPFEKGCMAIKMGVMKVN